MGSRLRYLRKLRGGESGHKLTQRVVSLATGISAPSISGMENDKEFNSPSLGQVRVLAAYYDVSVDWILEGGDFPEALHPGEIIQKPDELVWLHLWRSWSQHERMAALRKLGSLANRP